jgi:hypothetical protein
LRAEITPAPRSIASSKREMMPMKRYGADIDDLNRRTALYIDKILKGAAVGRLRRFRSMVRTSAKRRRSVGIVPFENAEVEELREWKVDDDEIRADPRIAREILE